MTPHRLLALVPLLSFSLACQTAFASSAGGRPEAPAAGLLPPARTPIEIVVGQSGAPKLSELMQQLSTSTGVTFTTSDSVRRDLESDSCGVLTSVTVPPEGAWLWVESLLVDRGFQISVQSSRSPWLVSVYPLQHRPGEPSARPYTHVPAEQIDELVDHPALWVSTVLELPHTDVRQLGNSLRGLTTDPTGQQVVIPVGNTNSVILTGGGRQVLQLVGMLRHVEAVQAATWEAGQHSRDETEQQTGNDAR